jgi:competence ComEA-like helix-hairpin-helix protein
VLAIVLVIGTLSDLHRARAPVPAPPPERFVIAATADTTVPMPAVGNPGPPPRAISRATPQLVDLDSASAADLDRLPGIGPVLAARIVEHRRLHGRFHHVDELLLVRGIGPRLLERLRPWLREPTR